MQIYRDYQVNHAISIISNSSTICQSALKIGKLWKFVAVLKMKYYDPRPGVPFFTLLYFIVKAAYLFVPEKRYVG